MSLDTFLTDLDAISAKMDSLFDLTDTFLAEQAQLLREEDLPDYDKLQSDYAKISEECKAGHVLFSKFSKNFEKKVKCDPIIQGEFGDGGLFGGFGGKSSAASLSEMNETVNLAIMQHFYRNGEISIADELAKEAGISPDIAAQVRAPFVEMHGLLDGLQRIDPFPDHLPALQWIQEKAGGLGPQGRRLQFQIHAAHYLDLIRTGQISDALMYAQEHFKAYATDYLSDIQMLLGSLAFAHRSADEPSPYGQTFASLWADVRTDLVSAYCRIHRLPRESSLEICFNVGTNALPKISQVISLMKARRGVEWTTEDQLPLEVEVPPQHRYHSVFICPVLRQQTTPENPPMMMICGHVICKEALTRLSKGNPNFKFKCPYCPQESSATQAIKVEF